jgi:hypothetical protein
MWGAREARKVLMCEIGSGDWAGMERIGGLADMGEEKVVEVEGGNQLEV